MKAYDQLLPFISDADENLALHAIVAFGSDTPEQIIQQLVQDLVNADPRRAPAASEVLRLIANDTVLKCLTEAASDDRDWVLATLGRLPAALVKPALGDSALMKRIAPMLLRGEGASWLASEDRLTDIAFLTKQDLEIKSVAKPRKATLVIAVLLISRSEFNVLAQLGVTA
ncbi:MAG TPA: hypothetical protein VE779_11210 [Candidatus Angelobacter sp.]|nr:hypothetical protein [Candidatus Angelobacter sp.]